MDFRPDALKVIILFTDGLSIDDPLKPAAQLRDHKGVKIYVVSVGDDGFKSEMSRIAGDCENVFGLAILHLTKFSNLFLVLKICPVLERLY